jgi:hypothetical protein
MLCTSSCISLYSAYLVQCVSKVFGPSCFLLRLLVFVCLCVCVCVCVAFCFVIVCLCEWNVAVMSKLFCSNAFLCNLYGQNIVEIRYHTCQDACLLVCWPRLHIHDWSELCTWSYIHVQAIVLFRFIEKSIPVRCMLMSIHNAYTQFIYIYLTCMCIIHTCCTCIMHIYIYTIINVNKYIYIIYTECMYNTYRIHYIVIWYI